MTCDQELVLIPEAWHWSKDDHTREETYFSLAYQYDKALYDQGVTSSSCSEPQTSVKKIVGVFPFVWQSFRVKGPEDEVSLGTSHPWFAEILEPFGQSLHELAFQVGTEITGRRDRMAKLGPLAQYKSNAIPLGFFFSRSSYDLQGALNSLISASAEFGQPSTDDSAEGREQDPAPVSQPMAAPAVLVTSPEERPCDHQRNSKQKRQREAEQADSTLIENTDGCPIYVID